MRSLRGKLLIAAPSLTDPNFARSVVFICEHRPEGAMGIVLNRPTHIPLEVALPQLPLAGLNSAPIFHGGPVETQRMLILHTAEHLAEPARSIPPGVYLGAALDLLNKLLAGDDPFRLYVGHAGWGEGQLDREIDEGAWESCDARREQIFSPGERLWQDCLGQISGENRLWSEFPAHPEMN